jgi:formylglycine-generating enzyme required for sulfatase activity
MGSPRSEPKRNENEIQHPVRVSSFWIGRYELTQAQWIAVMGRLPYCLAAISKVYKGDDMPVTCVSWEEAQEFVANLNEMLKLDKENGYSLPREAEWEYAARGGTTTPFPYGATITPELANYFWKSVYANGPTQSRERAYPMKVGSFPANPFGLYDMTGNAREWCEDWYGEYPVPTKGEQIDSTGPAQGEMRVLRGGDVDSHAYQCRSAWRGRLPPSNRPNLPPGAIGFMNLTSDGFRLVRRQ